MLQRADKQSSSKQAATDLRPLKTLLPYILRYKGMTAAALVALLTSSTAMLSIPVGIRQMIDYGFAADNTAFIDSYFLVLIGIGLVLACASASRFYCVTWLGERVVADLRANVFIHLTSLSPAFYEKTHSGEVMSRLTADTTQIKTAVGSVASQTLRNMVMLIGALIMMVLTSPYLSILVILAIPAIVFPLMAYGRSVKRLSRKAQDTLATASSYAGENLASIRTLQAFQHEHSAISRFKKAVEHSFGAAVARTQARAILTAMAMFLTFASIVVVLWVGAQSVILGEMTGGQLGQFVLYALFAAGAVGELSEVWGEIQQASGAAERLTELLNVSPQIQDPATPIILPHNTQRHLTFQNVSFAYPSQHDSFALDDINFEIAPGETIALVGPSGAGKTTLFALLLRFYDPTSGIMKIDDIPIDDMRLADLRKTISLVPQDVALFADSIAENIRYGTPDASLKDIENAARIAQAAPFIEELPEGFNTQLGERGITLSGGQRQRIAIARAVLKNAPILLLDEATSALDAENEQAVKIALEHIMQDRTTLVIAHRLATVKKADRILVMDKGKIVETGNHQTLIEKNGLYARLAKLQFADM